MIHTVPGIEERIKRMNAPLELPHNGPINNWIKSQFPDGYVGHAVDVGASDGRFINSTWLLEKKFRWTVLSVEANPYIKPLLMKERAFVKMCAVGSVPADDVDFHINMDNLEAFSGLRPQKEHKRFKEEAGKRWETIKVNVRTLEQLLAEAEFPKLDVLCVDVEGTERDVLASIDLSKWKPRAIVVECWDEGTLDDALPDYERMCRSAENDMYVRRSE